MPSAGLASIELAERRRSRRRPRAREAAGRSPRSLLAPALAGLLGGTLLALAVPELVAIFHMRSGWSAGLRSEGNPNGTGRLIESQLAAARWTNSPRPWWVMTIMREGRARGADLPPEARRAAQEQAEAAFRRLLVLSPANPDGWLRLARLYLDRGERAGASRALELSFATGWSGKDVLLRRSRFALQNWNRLAPYTRRRLANDFAGAFARAPREFVQIAVKTGQVDAVRDALAGIPSLRRQFDAFARHTERYKAVLGD